MTKRKDGLWQETITINGQRKYFYGKTKAEVLRKISAYQEQTTNGLTFEAVAEEWDEWHRETVSYNGHRCYSQPYKSALDCFGDSYINDITTPEIDAYVKRIAAKGYAKRTVQSYLACVNLIFEYGQLHGYCTNNPASVVPIPPKLKTTKRELPDENNIELVKQHVDDPFGIFAYFLLYTGCRRGEALALTYDDIDFKNKTISINKSLIWQNNKAVIKSTKTEAGRRTIILLDALAAKLPKGKGYVFGGEAPLTNTAFRRRWEKYVKTSGVTMTCHQLRHLFATILYECGIDEKLAQELLGHSSITVTRDVYTHIRRQHLSAAAEMLNEKIRI